MVEDIKTALGNEKFSGLSLFLLKCPKCASEWVHPAVVYESGHGQDSTTLRRYAIDNDTGNLLRQSALKRRVGK